ncbi:hypothetical protein R1T44_00360 [Cobetia amphilecti]|nr:hypothetical protein [Cobetia amphilecti]WOI25909.1 hypothetical protein R1T44_00360 [Cobetia amphilecti]
MPMVMVVPGVKAMADLVAMPPWRMSLIIMPILIYAKTLAVAPMKSR